MKKKKRKPQTRNHVAKYAHMFNKSLVIESKKRKQKSRQPKQITPEELS